MDRVSRTGQFGGLKDEEMKRVKALERLAREQAQCNRMQKDLAEGNFRVRSAGVGQSTTGAQRTAFPNAVPTA